MERVKEMLVEKNGKEMLLSDAEPYMTKAAQSLKVIHSRLLPVTCTAHSLHNC